MFITFSLAKILFFSRNGKKTNAFFNSPMIKIFILRPPFVIICANISQPTPKKLLHLDIF